MIKPSCRAYWERMRAAQPARRRNELIVRLDKAFERLRYVEACAHHLPHVKCEWCTLVSQIRNLQRRLKAQRGHHDS